MTEALTQPLGTPKPARHRLNYEAIDQFLDDVTVCMDHPELAYVHFVLSHARKSAVERMVHDRFMKRFKLFVDFNGKTWRVTGASRLGDIWLTPDFEQEVGYQLRVDPDFTKFTHWRAEPNAELTWDQQMALGVKFYGVELGKQYVRTNPGRCIRYVNILKRAKVPKRYLETSPEERQFLHEWEQERRNAPPEPELEPQQGW